MRLLLVLDHKFLLRDDGSVWAHTMFGPTFFQRYLSVFEDVRVVARLKPSVELPVGAERVDGSEVSFASTPYFEGARQLFHHRDGLRRILAHELSSGRAVVLRLFQSLPDLAAKLCHRSRIPFGAEIVGDPWDTFSPGAIRHPLRPVIRTYLAWRLWTLCRQAGATSYVTASALQRRYPPRPDAFSTHASSIELKTIAESPRREADFIAPHRLLFVGGLNHFYKGQDTLLNAAGILHGQGVPFELVMVGDGKYRPHLTDLAVRLGIQDRVQFLGALPAGKAIFDEMNRSHLFVLPSRQEGLPRAAIEAMSRGLPVLLSAVGGNAELVPPGELVRPNDPGALATRILEKLSNPAKMVGESARNLTRSREYLDVAINPRRTAFYREVLRLRQAAL